MFPDVKEKKKKISEWKKKFWMDIEAEVSSESFGSDVVQHLSDGGLSPGDEEKGGRLQWVQMAHLPKIKE